jgi:corrinoid protein of di/trimethylamine methyltransferase
LTGLENGPASRKAEILAALASAVDKMDEEGSVKAANDALAAGIDAYEAITKGLSKGMEVVSDKYEKGIYFVPEILLCADAMYAAIGVLRPHLKADKRDARTPIVIGVIEGDIHDIGKNIVKLMLDASGFPVHDLGNDVSVAAFVHKARELKHGIVAVSTLMSTTMPGMGRLVKALEDAGLRKSFRVLIGGGPVSADYAKKIGADACGANAMEAVRIATAWEEAKR